MNFAVIVLGVGLSASALAAPLYCGDSQTTYQVATGRSHTAARVTRLKKTVRFGDLNCVKLGEAEDADAFLSCRSRNVADAGYNAVFYRGESPDRIYVQLGEIWFGGERPLETLRCAEIGEGPHHRTLFLNGEESLSGVEVVAHASIEVHIATTAGTGYQWELEKPLTPHTAQLVGGPEFIPGSSTPGGAGNTRFWFVVDENPQRGFTLFFQLKRPWETTPIKKFHIRFHASRS